MHNLIDNKEKCFANPGTMVNRFQHALMYSTPKMQELLTVNAWTGFVNV